MISLYIFDNGLLSFETTKSEVKDFKIKKRSIINIHYNVFESNYSTWNIFLLESITKGISRCQAITQYQIMKNTSGVYYFLNNLEKKN